MRWSGDVVDGESEVERCIKYKRSFEIDHVHRVWMENFIDKSIEYMACMVRSGMIGGFEMV